MSLFNDAMFYHIYPLGLCGAPKRNDFSKAVVNRLDYLHNWIEQAASLHLNAIYLGPLFESTAHGYDTADYFQVDRRLGTQADLLRLISTIKAQGMRVIFDGVFNHVGRDFWAFRDVQMNGRDSAYVDWFDHLNFEQRSPYGDGFSYQGWAGHFDLVKLNLRNPQVQQHLFDAVRYWVETYAIDGLRLDAADVLDHDFIRALATTCRSLKPDFWLMGEVVHGDYRRWANAELLDATTNYECYKGLYSSHVDANYFEIAYSLNRQFGAEGRYRDLRLYSFADNHDVNRVASSLSQAEHLYPLYLILFTMPGIPSIYYGSEWGISGKRSRESDEALRPMLDLKDIDAFPNRDLAHAIRQFAVVRAALPALRHGDYQQLHVNHEQLAFARSTPEQTVVVVVNASNKKQTLTLKLPQGSRLVDQLNQDCFPIADGRAAVTVYPHWGGVLVVE